MIKELRKLFAEWLLERCVYIMPKSKEKELLLDLIINYNNECIIKFFKGIYIHRGNIDLDDVKII